MTSVGIGDRAPDFSLPGTDGRQYVGAGTCLECHDDIGAFYAHSPHAPGRNLLVPGTAAGACEACHGPGSAHVEAGGEGGIVGADDFAAMAADLKVAMCTQCHATDAAHWADGPHAGAEIGCADCHADQVHFGGRARPRSDFRNPAEFCLQCHADQAADFRLPFRHRALEGQIGCTDCHDPHADFDAVALDGLNTVCLGCHQEMSGPWVFEHEGVEGEECTVCHRPHGSQHDKLLLGEGNGLCLQCHYDVAFGSADDWALGTVTHSNDCTQCHASTPSGVPPHGTFVLGDEGRCTDCHSGIHGSNVSATFLDQ